MSMVRLSCRDGNDVVHYYKDEHKYAELHQKIALTKPGHWTISTACGRGIKLQGNLQEQVTCLECLACLP